MDDVSQEKLKQLIENVKIDWSILQKYNGALEFEDSYLDDFPRMSVGCLRALSDAEITNLVKLMEKNVVKSYDGFGIIHRCLLILALSEFRDPRSKGRVFTLKDDDYKGKAGTPIFYPNLTSVDSIPPDEYEKDKKFIDAYLEIQNDCVKMKEFKTLAHYDLDNRCYIGAWSLFQFRSIAKDEKQMKVYEDNRTFFRLFRTFYGEVSSNLRFPALGPEIYNHIRCGSGRATIPLVCMKHMLLNKGAAEARNIAVYEALEGFLMGTLEYHKLPLYTWLISASKVANITTGQMLTQCETIHRASGSLRRLTDFIHRYIDGPQAKQRRYFPIARILNDKYLFNVGRKNNDCLIACLYTICKTAKPSIYFVGSTDSGWEDGCGHGRRIARELGVLPRSS